MVVREGEKNEDRWALSVWESGILDFYAIKEL
jgi:hypothetical protein